MFNVSLFNEPLFNLTAYPSLSHYLISGNYQFLNKSVNRVVVIGKDNKDDLVFGTYDDFAEGAYAGERLMFKLMPALESEAEADAAAEALQAEQDMSMVAGVITCPPNCGAELYDVIRIFDDSLPFQGGINYRIIGIQNHFNALTGNFIQKLFLCAL